MMAMSMPTVGTLLGKRPTRSGDVSQIPPHTLSRFSKKMSFESVLRARVVGTPLTPNEIINAISHARLLDRQMKLGDIDRVIGPYECAVLGLNGDDCCVAFKIVDAERYKRVLKSKLEKSAELPAEPPIRTAQPKRDATCVSVVEKLNSLKEWYDAHIPDDPKCFHIAQLKWEIEQMAGLASHSELPFSVHFTPLPPSAAACCTAAAIPPPPPAAVDTVASVIATPSAKTNPLLGSHDTCEGPFGLLISPAVSPVTRTPAFSPRGPLSISPVPE